MKQYLKDNQEKFYQLLENQFKQNKVSHAYLLVGDNTNIPATFLAMSLICDSKLACETCIDCNKIKNNKYGDMITYDGIKETIKKGNVEYIQETFKKSSLEGKSKIYILENIENATKEAMNSLLKMLEEPIEGVYAIFTTKNINRVLPTIKSRCLVVDIKTDNKTLLRNQLLESGIDLVNANILTVLTNTVDEATILNDERFEYMKLQVINFIEDLCFKRDNLVINTYTNLLKNYKSKEDIRLFLNMLVLGMKDMFHVKHNQKLFFEDKKELFASCEIEINDIIKKIELVLETNYLLESNANIALLMDRLMYRL